VTNRPLVLSFLGVLALAALAQAQTFSTLHYFTGHEDGASPYAGLIQDPTGNIYGTSSGVNAQDGFGSVFEISKTPARFTVLHSFPAIGPATPLVRDAAGNFYGTAGGGSADAGIVFKIDAAGNFTVLYSFSGGSDGCGPAQGLIRDKTGSSYGTTIQCGADDGGTLFKLDRSGKFALLYTFTGGVDGGPRFGHLSMDESGNLYGVTQGGGAYGYGMLYKLSKNGKLTVLQSFAGGALDGCFPFGSVLRDKAGNLYGTTSQCGSHGYGNIWKVSASGKEIILHNFAGGTSDGCYPWGGVTRDPTGNLYGVALGCGANGYFGAVYELSAKGRLKLLHSFDDSNGEEPVGEVLRTAKGTLYGTTLAGGTGSPCVRMGCGTVWKYVP
jgi:uncharacterized repeat protein (TIGR03803 family)